MKRSNLLVSALFAAILVGCGGGGSSDAPVATTQVALGGPEQPPAIQRMLSGGTDRVKQGSAAASPKIDDIVAIAGYRANYTVNKDQQTGVVTVTNNSTKEVKTYNNPNLIKFADYYTTFDTNGSAGSVYRLYQAAFNRKPDLPGLGFWIYAAANGRSLNEIADGFINSDEFSRTYGAKIADSVYVNQLYMNVLHRAGEAEGVKWWGQVLTAGTPRNSVITGFSESDENKNNVNPGLINGFDYVPFVTDTVTVAKTSHDNKLIATQLTGAQTVPVTAGGGLPQDGFAYFHGYGFADFFQDKTISMVTASTEYLNDPHATVDTAKPGHIKFWKKDEKGAWIDRTKDMLADDVGCLLARKVVIADFNGDGKPDVFFACSGYDGEPFRGERPRVLMSQANGTYTNKQLDINCFCHGGAAADFNGDGYADILVGDFLEGKGAYFLKNNKDGTFTADYNRLPANAVRMKGAIFSVDLVDMNGDGKADVWLAGNEKDWPTSIFLNDGKNSFATAKQIVMPADALYNTPMDISVSGNFAYVLRTPNNYDGASIQKVDLTTMQSTTIYTNVEWIPNQPFKWIDWIAFKDGQLIGVNAVMNLSIKM